MKPLKYPRSSINRRLNISKRLKLLLQSSLTDVHKAFEKKEEKEGKFRSKYRVKHQTPQTVYRARR